MARIGAIQVIHNAVGGRGRKKKEMYDMYFPEKSITKMYGSALLALRGD